MKNVVMAKSNQIQKLGNQNVKKLLSLAMLAVLTGCGGGGGGGDDGAPEGPTTPTPAPQPGVTLPSPQVPSSHSGFNLAVYERLNQARVAAGVSALKQNAQLDAAAAGHANYLIQNNVTGHYQQPSDPHFTGADPAARARSNGYGGYYVTELVNSFYRSSTGKEHVDAHLNSVYHLYGALSPEANEIGIGVQQTSTSSHVASALTLGASVSNVVTSSATVKWPVADAVGSPTAFYPATENPNPLPDLATSTSVGVGAPVMFCGARAQAGTSNTYGPITVSDVQMNDSKGSVMSNVRILRSSRANVQAPTGIDVVVDSNMDARWMHNCIFIVQKQPLTRNERYTVTIRGIQAGVAGDNSINASWSFTTGQ